jgi:hypothetical protein
MPLQISSQIKMLKFLAGPWCDDLIGGRTSPDVNAAPRLDVVCVVGIPVRGERRMCQYSAEDSVDMGEEN